ncbi:MAG: polysaccharide lyase family protein [Verrucomicrobiota bacterium]
MCQSLFLGVLLLGLPRLVAAPQPKSGAETIFCLGVPDQSSVEFGLTRSGYAAFSKEFSKPVEFVVGKDSLEAWPFIHPSTHDTWAGSKAHTFTIRFPVKQIPAQPVYLVVGQVDSLKKPLLTVSLNGREIGKQRAPQGKGVGHIPGRVGEVATLVFPIPAGSLKPGENTLALNLDDGSWIIYDYVYLGTSQAPEASMATVVKEELLPKFLAGPLKDVEEIVFATRKVGSDGHWYANIGYYSDCELEYPQGKPFTHNGKRVAYRLGGKLGKLNVKTGKVTWLVEDAEGGVRDPIVHYDGKTILFSYRKGNGENYHLYTIQSDGSGLKQLTTGDYDDFEPCWLPEGGMVFVSTRAKRWVNCWVTQVATLHRCDANGSNIRMISANNEQDNTPWALPDGRLIYQRWEYVDRSQVDYHHLWTTNPDGTGQMIYFGNQRPGIVMIDAKPIPGSPRIAAIFSPGHGRAEHAGALVVVDPSNGPDQHGMARYITRTEDYRDPWAFSEEAFMAAKGPEIQLLTGAGQSDRLYRLSDEEVKDGFLIHEPRPIVAHDRELVVPTGVNLQEPTGRLVMANVYEGRNLAGVKPGEIKKLLVLETLPKPVNFTGGMDPLTYGGSFTLERVVGTVPVEADGSAYMELPALRGLFFVALDEHDMAVKRMQSFLTVQPGETTSCVGCHEQRTQSYIPGKSLAALRRPASKIQPIKDCPDVLDFPRDIQPILNRLCVDCHDATPTPRGGPYAGKVLLSGDHGPMFSHAYFNMTVHQLFTDGRNRARSNYGPRELGSSASRILQMLDGSHYGVKASEAEKTRLRLWTEVGSPYPGTYAALGSGSVGGYQENQQIHLDTDWPATKAAAQVMDQRCAECHKGQKRLPHTMSDELGMSFWRFAMDDPRLKYSRHSVFNLSRPAQSLLALAPLDKAAGGLGICVKPATGAAVFSSTSDPDYLKLVEMAVAGRDHLEKIKRFDMPGFLPREGWYREMRRYGILAADFKSTAPVDFYKVEQAYWKSMWYQPAGAQ